MYSSESLWLIPVLIVVAVQSVVLYYFGKQGAIYSTLIMSIIGAILWQIVISAL